MTLLIGTDLDRTLLYSRTAVDAFGDGGRRLVAVERYRDADASWMTLPAARLFAGLAGAATVVVPVTTRTVEQWRRVALPGPPPRYVIAANGATLLVDDQPDHAWDVQVARALARVAPLAEVVNHVRVVLSPDWTVSLREVDGMFCYAVVERDRIPPDLLATQAVWAGEHGWRVSLQGRKLYWVPTTLTKGAALAEVASRIDAATTITAGDSLLDADLLLAADAAMMPRHGELAASGWHAPHVVATTGDGVLAGEEIVRWFAGHARRDAPVLSA